MIVRLIEFKKYTNEKTLLLVRKVVLRVGFEPTRAGAQRIFAIRGCRRDFSNPSPYQARKPQLNIFNNSIVGFSNFFKKDYGYIVFMLLSFYISYLLSFFMENISYLDIPEEFREHLKPIRDQQLKLAKQLDLSSKVNLGNLSLVAGLDVAFLASDELACAGITVVDFRTLEIIEEHVEFFKPTIPYIPTFLYVRESPGYFAVIQKLEEQPDLFMFDGNGIIHPYGLGLASQMGLELNQPTIGIAKELLLGDYQSPLLKGGYSDIYYNDKTIGVAYQSMDPPAKPIYASQGHQINLSSVINILREFTQSQIYQSKLPLPIFLADKLVKENLKDQ